MKTDKQDFTENEFFTHDSFGNKVEILKLSDNRYKKVTQTNRHSRFEFLNSKYSISILESAGDIKTYWDEYHSVRKLVQDCYGRLFHYRYDEEMNFDGGDDRVDILWILVADEKDSDELSNNSSSLSLLREPYVAADETGWVAAHEYTEGLK